MLLVAGSGRSGTSLMGLVLKELGLHVPQPELPADDTNPLGFAEAQWVVDLHKTLLSQACVQGSDARPSAWADVARLQEHPPQVARVSRWLSAQFDGAPGRQGVVLIKDPRLLWFLPLWRSAAAEACASAATLTMLRHPAAVVRSKVLAYGRDPRSAPGRVAGWVNTMLFLERATRGEARCYVRYDGLLEDWSRTLEEAAASLQLDDVLVASTTQRARAAALVRPDLRRASDGWDGLDVPPLLVELAEEAWAALLELERPDPAKASSTRLDVLRQRYVEYYEEAESVAQSSVLAAARRARAAGARRA